MGACSSTSSSAEQPPSAIPQSPFALSKRSSSYKLLHTHDVRGSGVAKRTPRTGSRRATPDRSRRSSPAASREPSPSTTPQTSRRRPSSSVSIPKRNSSVASAASSILGTPDRTRKRRSSAGFTGDPNGADGAGAQAHERVLQHKASAVYRLEPQTQKEVLLLFHKLKQKQASDVVVGNKFVGDADYEALRTMDFKGLKDMLPATDEATLRFIFRFFDDNLDGRINTAEFLMAVAMLCQPCDTAQEQLDACFRMFDADESGCLSRAEFGEMIAASVALDLGQLLLTPEGEEQMEVQLEKEFAQETIRFWREAVAFREAPGELSGIKARAIYEQYVREGAPEEINLPAKQRAQIDAAFAAAAAAGKPPPPDIFERAETEMFALMEKNAFTRLRGDGQMLDELADAFFSRADVDGDGIVRFDEYRQWASEQPQVLAFFGQLRNNIRKLVATAAQQKDEPIVEEPERAMDAA